MTHSKKLPLDVSSFDMLISENYLYVDKTEIIHQLIGVGRCFFLSRPRRFGKTLLITTLKELFTGNAKLFTGTWIGQGARHEWKEHPIIHIDFSDINRSSAESMEKDLIWTLEKIARSYELDISSAPSIQTKFSYLVELLAKREKVVVLIDEYDAPILEHVHNEKARDIVLEMRAILRGFYSAVKAANAHMRFLMVTGVSKFSKGSIFSGMNHLIDLSFNPIAATLVGYTEQELTHYLSPYIEEIAQLRNTASEEIITEMRLWYNGYRFSDALTKVYNPFSVLHYLSAKKCKNFWFSTGSTKFLFDLAKCRPEDYEKLDHTVVSEETLSTFEPDLLPISALLYQAGYLTIEEYLPEVRRYKITYPNEEVRLSMRENLIGMFLKIDREAVEPAITRMRTALFIQDIDAFCAELKVLFANIPYTLHTKKESYYHSIFHAISSLLGMDVQSEVLTSAGRIDMILQTLDSVFIFEFKFEAHKNMAEKLLSGPAQAIAKALMQIKANGYVEKYQASGKKIFLIGMVFGYAGKNRLVVQWQSEKS